MARIKQVYDFALKWLDKFRDQETSVTELVNHYMEDDCKILGFDMYYGGAFEQEYGVSANDYKELEWIINDVDDIDLLGSAIYSKWEYFNHWENKSEDILQFENRSWFILALDRLARLARENIFEGEANKVRIISNNLGFGIAPEPTKEVEQDLTIRDNGQVSLIVYMFGQGCGKYEKARSYNFNIGKKKASIILDTFARYFSQGYDEIFATDIGGWSMELTNKDGKTYNYVGSLCADLEVDGADLSDLIRDTLEMDDLYLLDGNKKPDKINKILVDYHRVPKNKPDGMTADSVDYDIRDYREQLIIDRESESIEHIQRIGSGCNIYRKYQVDKGVSALLDEMDADSLFTYIKGNPEDVVDNSNESKDYTITVDFKKSPQMIVKGSFNKNGLPEDWPEFAKDIFDFLSTYDLGEILNPSVYKKVLRREGEFMFCSVEFSKGGKTYYYLSEDDTIQVGDWVVVPVGRDGDTAKVKVVNIEYFSEEDAPFPIDKVKRIIG